MHATEGEMVCESNNPKIPYFNAPIFLENKVCNAVPEQAYRGPSSRKHRHQSARSTRSLDP